MWTVARCIVSGCCCLFVPLFLHFLSNFQTLKFFITLFSGTVKPRRLKTWYTREQWADVSCVPESGCCCLIIPLLAHLSRRLTRWAYSIAMARRPSVVVVHTFKPVYLWSQLTNLDQILCVASLGWGKGCIRFWGRLDQNSGFHGNRKPPLTYNGKNDVSTFSRLFLIRSFLYLQVTRTYIKSRTSLNFDQIGPLTMELAALERLKNFP